MSLPGLRACLNEDDSNFFLWNRFTAYDEKELRTLIDHYDIGGVDQIMFNINAQCVNYPGSVREMLGSREQCTYGAEPVLARNFCDGVRGFAGAGINPYEFWLAEARRRGISPWISIRTNDIHEVFDEEHYLHSEFWRSHPEFRRVLHRRPAIWEDKALDFEHAEVREHLLALVRETLEKFDLDGIELDWMRFPFHFRPGREARGRTLTLELHREIRRLADKAAGRLGHRVGVAVRVAAEPQTAWGLGFDWPAMSREGLVDIVTPIAFWASTDTAMPIALWRALLSPETRLYAGMELRTRAFPGGEAIYSTPSMVRSQWASCCYQGADKLYLFNYMDFMLKQDREHVRPLLGTSADTRDLAADFREIVGGAGNPENAAAGSRRAVVTYCDTAVPGTPINPVLPARLRGVVTLRLPVGPAPEPGRAAAVVLGISEPLPPGYAVYLNGKALAQTALPADCTVPGESGELIAFDAVDAVQEGDNILELVVPAAGNGEVRWAEINISARSTAV